MSGRKQRHWAWRELLANGDGYRFTSRIIHSSFINQHSPNRERGMSEAVRKHKEYLWPAVSMYYKEPIALVKGEGNYVWDDTGKRYLDAFGGVLTVSIGHANPKVVNAIVEQVKKLSHTSTLYAHPQLSNLAEKLAS